MQHSVNPDSNSCFSLKEARKMSLDGTEKDSACPASAARASLPFLPILPPISLHSGNKEGVIQRFGLSNKFSFHELGEFSAISAPFQTEYADMKNVSQKFGQSHCIPNENCSFAIKEENKAESRKALTECKEQNSKQNARNQACLQQITACDKASINFVLS